MSALLVWLLRLASVALIARRTLQQRRALPARSPAPGRAGSLALPDVSRELRGIAREVRAALRETFWSLARREILVLLVSAFVVGTVVAAAVLAGAR